MKAELETFDHTADVGLRVRKASLPELVEPAYMYDGLGVFDNEIGLGLEFEPLFGSVTIHVIPEPATLVLLLVGLSLKFRRPKVA